MYVLHTEACRCKKILQGDQISMWKVAQNVAKPVFRQNKYRTDTLWKSSYTNLPYLCNFQKTFQSKQEPNRRKFAQSDHPADHLHMYILWGEAQPKSALVNPHPNETKVLVWKHNMYVQ
jgi:hypothetical protein